MYAPWNKVVRILSIVSPARGRRLRAIGAVPGAEPDFNLKEIAR